MATVLLALAPGAWLQLTGSACVGGAAAMVVWWLVTVLRTEDVAQGAEWRYDVSRINELRRADTVYRVFQPVVGILAAMNRAVFPESMPVIHREIQASGLPRFWLAEEYLGKLELVAVFFTPIYVYVFFDVLGSTGLFFAPVAVLLTAWFLRYRLAVRARTRLRNIKRRMPFLLDLLTLLMEAGSTFIRAMDQAVKEFRGHPVAEEFGRVLSDMNLGKTRVEAFQAMRDRLNDDEITSIIGSVLQGEVLGTPLAQIFRTQAEVLRLKRTQRAETVAAEAGVNMLLPGVLIMVSTVLVIVGPFLLNYLYVDMAL
jgi:tight adherence protein C